MLKNYFLLAVRNILRNRFTSAINIVGLSVGIAASILVLLYVANELSYDRFYPDYKRVYRLAVEALIGDTEIHQTYSSALTFTRLMEEFPEIENGVKVIKIDKTPVTIEDQVFHEEHVFLADSSFFSVFPREIIAGPHHNLNRPNTIMLDASSAERYFGNAASAVGEAVSLDIGYGFGRQEFEVTGVYADFPPNAHFHPQMIFSSNTFPSLIHNQGWSANNFVSYLLLKEGSDASALGSKLEEFTRKNIGAEFYDEWVSQGNYWNYFLQPLSSIHLLSDLNGEFEANGNATYVRLFVAIAVFLLLIASINFMNLTTARSSLRSLEVAVRKAYGAQRKRLVMQFMGESIVITFVAIIIGLVLAQLLLPVFGNIVDRSLSIGMFNPWLVIFSIIVCGLVLALFSGFYPSFVLSSFNTVEGMKGRMGTHLTGLGIRRALVIVQFTIAIILIISTITVIRQMKYMQNKDLGFVKEHLLVLENPGQSREGIDAFREEILKNPNINTVTVSNFIPGQEFANIGFGAEGLDEGFTLNIGRVDEHFLEAFQIPLKTGRFFSDEFPSDSCAVVLNEQAVDLLGWNDDPLNRKINNWSDDTRGDFHVVGVVENFHYESLHSRVRPMALFLNGGYYSHRDGYLSLKMATSEVPTLLDDVENVWKQCTGRPFIYFFMDDEYDRLYVNESQTRRIFIFFASIAIIIACLGLFGLSSFVTLQRTREIGIRKVMGASPARIVILLNRQFTIWVVLSNLIGWPAAWFLMSNWLENFAFRTPLSIWIFLIAALLALVIASFIVSFQSISAARMNPVEAIKYK